MSTTLNGMSVCFRCKRFDPDRPGVRKVSHTQEKVEGWDQRACAQAVVHAIGAGGITSAMAPSLAKQGFGEVQMIDHDIVEPSNLNRQAFREQDLYQPKAHALARFLSEISYLGTVVSGHHCTFLEFTRAHPDLIPDVGIVGVDNDRARAQACRWYLDHDRPLVCVGISRTADSAYIFVQQPQSGCLGCFLGKHLVSDGGSPCPGAPAVMDVLQVAGGFGVYAVSSLVMPRPRDWNLIQVSMADGLARAALIERRFDCPMCGRTAAVP